jgi:hypothetical protein
VAKLLPRFNEMHKRQNQDLKELLSPIKPFAKEAYVASRASE